MTISKPILAGLLLTCGLFGSACFNIVGQDTPNQDASNQGAPDQDASNQGAPNQDAPNQGAPNQDASNQGAPNQNVSNQDASNQNTSTQGSFGYGFEPDQLVAQGNYDEPTSPSGPAGTGRNSTTTPPPTSQTPGSSTSDTLVLGDPPEQRVTGMTPEPFPEGRLPPQSSAGIFVSRTMIIIMVALLILMVVSGIGVVRNW